MSQRRRPTTHTHVRSRTHWWRKQRRREFERWGRKVMYQGNKLLLSSPSLLSSTASSSSWEEKKERRGELVERVGFERVGWWNERYEIWNYYNENERGNPLTHSLTYTLWLHS
jgi:hypothetical protein